MKVFIASDHAGVELKADILKRAKAKVTYLDLGTNSNESCDYPLFAKKLCDEVLKNPGSLGVLICGTGVGMSIAANKVKGIRAACVSETVSAKMAREHNNCQILCVGARVINVEQAEKCLEAFFTAKFDTSNPRHQRRVDQISAMESAL